jgi:integrase
MLAAQQVASRYHPLLYTMSRTGLRLGEAVALRWDDVDFVARELVVRRMFSGRARNAEERVDASRSAPT